VRSTWIAEEPVIFLFPDGRRVEGRIAIAQPAPATKFQGAFECELAIDCFEQAGPIYGDSSLQALLLATQFLANEVHRFLRRGGRVLYPGESGDAVELDVPLDAFFGALLRQR
jgi:hypothetical protein